MIDNQQVAIFKSNQDFNKNKEKILQYIKYAENWQVTSVICSYTVMVCDVLIIIAMIVFPLKYCKTIVMLFQCGSSPFKFKSFSIKFGIWNNSSSYFMCSTSKIY